MQNNLTLKVREIVAGYFRINPDRLTDDARFLEDLGADWLDRLELLIAIEDQVSEFEFADVIADQIDTVGDLLSIIERRNWENPTKVSASPQPSNCGSRRYLTTK
jgi:acyl carrier protein